MIQCYFSIYSYDYSFQFPVSTITPGYIHVSTVVTKLKLAYETKFTKPCCMLHGFPPLDRRAHQTWFHLLLSPDNAKDAARPSPHHPRQPISSSKEQTHFCSTDKPPQTFRCYFPYQILINYPFNGFLLNAALEPLHQILLILVKMMTQWLSTTKYFQQKHTGWVHIRFGR